MALFGSKCKIYLYYCLYLKQAILAADLEHFDFVRMVMGFEDSRSLFGIAVFPVFPDVLDDRQQLRVTGTAS